MRVPPQALRSGVEVQSFVVWPCLAFMFLAMGYASGGQGAAFQSNQITRQKCVIAKKDLLPEQRVGRGDVEIRSLKSVSEGIGFLCADPAKVIGSKLTYAVPQGFYISQEDMLKVER